MTSTEAQEAHAPEPQVPRVRLHTNSNGLGVDVFTTGQIARLCGVAPRTVAKWFDAGRLKGYRIPGCADRRVTRKDLLAFFREHGMPVPSNLEGPSCLACGLDTNTAAHLSAACAGHGLRFTAIASLFELGMAMATRPRVIVLDLSSLGRTEGADAALRLAAAYDGSCLVVVGLLPEDVSPGEVPATAGFRKVLGHPVDHAKLAAAVLGELGAGR